MMSSPGILYFLTNEAMPGLVKIGHTTGDLSVRMSQLNTTGTPSPFQVAAIFYVSDSAQCEKEVHKELAAYRSNPKREFFSHPVAGLITQSINVVSKYILPSALSTKHENSPPEFEPDNDDICFMFFLLHDGYEQGQPFSSAELAEHHSDYAPLEVELKLIQLQAYGFVKRINREQEGMGFWQLLPQGVKYMFEGNHHAQDLVAEARSNA